jgi:hypothetical protein
MEKNKAYKKIFYNKQIMKLVLSYLNNTSQNVLKNCFKRSGIKDKKKQIKESIKQYIIDFGKHQEKVKYRLDDNGSVIVHTSIFNIQKEYLKEFTHIYHPESEDHIELEKNELYEYLKVLPRTEFYLVNDKGDKIKISKGMIPYDLVEDNDSDEEDSEKKKYEMFYKFNEMDTAIDFSNKDALMERQKRFLDQMLAEKNKKFYPLEFVTTINYWTIIVCHGGYFAAGFFLRDQVVEHKSDHKYVTRKKAGQRQIAKDKAKKVKSSIGSQIRRDQEKKHQENIEYILNMNLEHLGKSDAIFLQAPGLNKTILVGENKKLSSFQKKIINIPYNCQRANYTFMMEVFEKLTTVTLELKDENITKLFK